MGEQDYIADVGAVGEQHHQAVDADPFAGDRRQAVFQRTHVVVILEHRLFVAGFLGRDLKIETRGLILGIVQFGKAVGDFAPGDVFKPLRPLGMMPS